MIGHTGSVWFWGPLAAALLLSAITVVAAYYYNRKRGRRTINAVFFQGPVQSGSSAVGAVLSFLPMILSKEIRADGKSIAMLAAVTLLFLISTLGGLWLYSNIQALPRPTERSVELRSPFYIAVQGVLFALLFTALMTVIALLMYSPAIGLAFTPQPKP